MKPDELMARATASGIDLITTFEQSVPEGQERALQAYDGKVPKQTKVIRTPEWTAADAAHACIGIPGHLYAAFAYRYAGDTSQRQALRHALLYRTLRDAFRDRWKIERTCATCDGTGLALEIVYDEVVDRRTGQTKRKAKGKPGQWETRDVTCPICRHFGTAPAPTEDNPALRRGAGRIKVVEQLVDLAIFEEWLTVHYVTGLLQLARDQCWAGLIGVDQGEWERTVQTQYRHVQCLIDTWCGSAYRMAADQLKDEADVA